MDGRGAGRRAPSMGLSVAAAATVTAVFVLSNAPTPVYLHWQSAWHFGDGTLTIIFAAYMVGLIATLLVAGKLADRYGRRTVLLPGLLAGVVASVLFLVASDVWWLIAARLFAGVSVGAAVTAGMAATVDLAPASRRRTGSLVASASMVLGAGLGPLLAGLVSSVSDAPVLWVFGVTTTLMGLAVAIVFILPLATPSVHARAGEQAASRGQLWSWPSAPRPQRQQVAWGVATFAPGLTATAFVLALGPSVLSRSLGEHRPLVAGVIACLMFLAATGVQFATARFSTRSHLGLSSVATVAAMVLLAGSVTLWHQPAVFLLSALLAGVGQGLGQLAGLTLIASHVPAAHRAESNAALNISSYVPAGGLPLITGYLADWLGLDHAVLIFSTVLAMVAVVAGIVIRHQTSETAQPAALHV